MNIEEYISENEPDVIETDDAGRWTRRIWQLEDGSHIVESYTYEHPVNTTKKQSFKVKHVTLEHVQLDANYQTIKL